MSTYSQKGNALVVVLVLVVIAAGGGYLGYKLFWSNQDKNTETIEGMMVDTAGDEEADNDMMSGEAGDNGMMGTDDGVVIDVNVSAQTREFAISASPYKFSVTEIRVKKGDTVKIVFKNEQGAHDWVVDEFNARTKVLQAGQTETIEFTADKTGTFEYYCSVMNHRQMGMVGKLIVE